MFNQAPINQLPINQSYAPVETTLGVLSLGSYSFCDDKLGFNSEDLRSSGEIDLVTSRNSQQNWGVLIQQLITSKTITLTVVMGADSKLELQQKIDELKAAVYVRETELINYWAGEYRAIKVTTTGIIQVNWRSDYSAEVSFELFANNPPNRYTKEWVTKLFLAVTSDFTFTLANAGNMVTNPMYYFIFSTWTVLTAFTINIGGYDITITNAIVAGDVITIDTLNAVVKKNGTVIGVRWPLTVGLQPGNNNIAVAFTGTVLVDITIVYYKHYL